MRVIGAKKLYISQLRLPGDIRLKAESDPHVERLAESFRKLGIFARLPVVRMTSKYSKVLIAGRDQVAALIKLGEPVAHCVCVECTHEESYQLSLAENTLRKTITQQQAEEIASPLLGWPPYVGSPSTTATKEMIESSRLLGLAGKSEANTRTRGGSYLNVPDIEEMTLRDLGMELTPEFSRETKVVHTELLRVGLYLAFVAACVTKMRERKAPIAPAILDRLTQDTAALRALASGFVPYALCPYCKGLGVDCEPCGGHRWVSESVYRAAPPKLKDEEDKVVMVDGQPSRLSDLLEA